MSRWLQQLTVVVLLVLLLASLPAAQARPAAQAFCAELLSSFLDNPADWGLLFNPAFAEQRELQAYLGRIEQVEACLPVLEAEQPELAASLAQRIEWLTIFATDARPLPQALRGSVLPYVVDRSLQEGDAGYLLPLNALNEPELDRLSELAGLNPPTGYAFVQVFGSIDQMPPSLAQLFAANPEAAGIAMCRYIALPLGQAGTEQRATQRQVLLQVLSHELVHAYVNASLACEDLDQLPVWFHEGLAIFYSNSDQVVSELLPGGGFAYTVDTAEYRQYAVNMRYLADRLGEPAFHTAVGAAVRARSVMPLLEPAGLATEQELFDRATDWDQARLLSNILSWLGRFAGMFVLLLVVLIGLVWLGTRRIERRSLPPWPYSTRREPFGTQTEALQVLNDPPAPPSVPLVMRPLPPPAPATVVLPAVVSPANDSELLSAIRAFANPQASLADLWQLLQRYPILLDSAALSLFERGLERVQRPETRTLLSSRLALLQRCKQIGAPRAFTELRVRLASREAVQALRTPDPQRRTDVATRLERLAQQPQPLQGAQPFFALLAAELRGTDGSTFLAALPPDFVQLYERVLALARAESGTSIPGGK